MSKSQDLAREAEAFERQKQREQESLPPIRTWVVRRYKPLDEAIEEAVVNAHALEYSDNNLFFVLFEAAGDGRYSQKMVRGFSGWIDFEEVVLSGPSVVTLN